MFQPVSSRVSFPELEQQVLQFWREHDIERRSEEEREDKPLFVLYEGPPTANGSPGIHHVLARVFKDVIPRYKSMKGFRPLRKGGWDTHGLPVELEIERELGLRSKGEIEAYGIERFNQQCRESVFRYVKDWEALTERIGFWIDMEHPYVTLENDYIETGWWIIKKLWDQGLVYQDMKGTPHCPRCVTSLSSHEVALGYQENTPDPSIYVKFRIPDSELRAHSGSELPPGVPTFLLAWTTTPWTLPGNTALAVDPDATYAVVELEQEGERLILARSLLEKVLGSDGYRMVTELPGGLLNGFRYEVPYDPVQYGAELRQFHRGEGGLATLEHAAGFEPHVITADFVSLEEGTGIVHIAPAFGDEDLNAGREHGLAFVQPVDLQGVVTGSYPFAGKFVKEADEEIIHDLQQRGLLYRRETYYHTYPFCWRCQAPLLYYAKSSWYIRTTAMKERLISGNQEIHWYPEHIRDGRFGEWLRNNVDWAISRERYWGTPLPVWQCQGCRHQHCVGSVAELEAMAVAEHKARVREMDLHRPFVDQLSLVCPQCQGEMHRVPEVIDAWFDSGAMPFAQWHYPFENQGMLEDGRFPADYICEAVDQT
ncbi:MAG: isoleucine--tRNA ligase, partial [Dehalococcoidia bacterium]